LVAAENPLDAALAKARGDKQNIQTIDTGNVNLAKKPQAPFKPGCIEIAGAGGRLEAKIRASESVLITRHVGDPVPSLGRILRIGTTDIQFDGGAILNCAESF
jgi:hypothetical protein